MSMFERFTERARQVVVLSQEEARLLKHNYIGTEHLLMGIIREEEGLAGRVLDSLDLSEERVRTQIVRIVGTGEEVTSGQIPFSNRAKRVLEVALREALSLGHNYIGTEHILLSLVRDTEGVSARLLKDFDVDSEMVRTEVVRMLNGPRLRKAGTPGSRSVAHEAFQLLQPQDSRAGLVADQILEKLEKDWDRMKPKHLAELALAYRQLRA